MSFALLAALATCAAAPPDPSAGAAPAAAPSLVPDQPCRPPGANWRRAATADDAGRLRQIRNAWVESLAQARAGHAAEIDAAGPLFDPDAALRDPAPPPGDYECRTVKLGTQAAGGATYVDYPANHCRIGGPAGATLSFVRVNGPQRPIGRIFPDTTRRMIFLGTVQLGDERRAYRYGTDRDRDQIATVERIGPRRWRLVFPHPHFESKLDVIELVPRGD